MLLNFRRNKETDEDLIVDRVTGTFNRRQLDLDLAGGVDPSGMSTATLMIAIDKIDRFGKMGSAAVNQILERVAWVVMATVRTSDIVYRHNDSTFCVLLPATSDGDALIVAERVRSNIESTPLLCQSRVTVSVGVAIGASRELTDTFDRADAARGAACAAGNRVVVN